MTPNRRARLSAAALVLLLLAGALASCSTRYADKLDVLERHARVAVLIVDQDGAGYRHGAAQPYIYNALIQRRLAPVALNAADVKSLYRVQDKLTAAVSTVEAGQDKTGPLLLEPEIKRQLGQFFERCQIHYLLIVHVGISAYDERLQGVLIRADDMTVVASHYYDYRIMGAMCGGTFFISWLYCPWMFLRDEAAPAYWLVYDMLGDFMAARRKE